jgi:hypothetical protein
MSLSFTVTPHALFGGALSVSLPVSFADVSNLREVPDHQEVFLCTTNGMCFILEIVEYQSGIVDELAARYFWDDLANYNSATETHEWIELTRDTHVSAARAALHAIDQRVGPLVACSGVQVMPTVRDRAPLARIFLAVIRLPSVGCELIVTVNRPISEHSGGSSGGGSSASGSSASASGSIEEENAAVFLNALSTLEILDWTLFSASPPPPPPPPTS